MNNIDYSRHYPKIAQLLLSPDHETFRHGIELGTALELLRQTEWVPGFYDNADRRRIYTIKIFEKSFFEYLRQKHPGGERPNGTQYIHYNSVPDLNYYSMTVHIDT